MSLHSLENISKTVFQCVPWLLVCFCLILLDFRRCRIPSQLLCNSPTLQRKSFNFIGGDTEKRWINSRLFKVFEKWLHFLICFIFASSLQISMISGDNDNMKGIHYQENCCQKERKKSNFIFFYTVPIALFVCFSLANLSLSPQQYLR